ncbi:MAG: hypothetical protein ACKVOQ_06770 [Cyclobacteriaceae bacterium]
MKKLIVAVAMLVVVSGTLPMVQAMGTGLEISTRQADEKVKMKMEDLPEAVKTTLATEPYSGWKAETAYLNKTKDHYEIEVKKGTEKRTLKFSKDGKAVE